MQYSDNQQWRKYQTRRRMFHLQFSGISVYTLYTVLISAIILHYFIILRLSGDFSFINIPNFSSWLLLRFIEKFLISITELCILQDCPSAKCRKWQPKISHILIPMAHRFFIIHGKDGDKIKNLNLKVNKISCALMTMSDTIWKTLKVEKHSRADDDVGRLNLNMSSCTSNGGIFFIFFPSLILFCRRQKSKVDGLKWSDFGGGRWVGR